MRVIPVIDIRNGIAVRGVAGERDQYRPVESCLTDSHRVIDVAEGIRRPFGLSELYLADLDGILDDRPHCDLYAELVGRGFQLAVDAGLCEVTQAEALIRIGIEKVIAGLETLAGPQTLQQLYDSIGPERVIFSLDMKNGKLMLPATSKSAWMAESDGELTPSGIADIAIRKGCRQMILLDVGSVGVGGGLTTAELCRSVRSSFPDIELITGGGIRNPDDLQRISDMGIDGVLVATALHNGSIRPEHLRRPPLHPQN